MTKHKGVAYKTSDLLSGLSPEQACSVGTAVGSLIKDGMPAEDALRSTRTIAEFLKRGQAAQKAVDAILAAGNSGR